MRVRRLDHFGVDVADLARAERFYTEVLGMSVHMRLPDQVLLSYGDANCALFLKPDRAPADPETIRNPLGKSHHAFEVAASVFTRRSTGATTTASTSSIPTATSSSWSATARGDRSTPEARRGAC
jgi:catechol 2,3-dioxygenase-like lactoylglutathione lyase family enzyme